MPLDHNRLTSMLMCMRDKTNLAAVAASHYPTLINKLNSHDDDFTDESILIASLMFVIQWRSLEKKSQKRHTMIKCFRAFIEEG